MLVKNVQKIMYTSYKTFITVGFLMKENRQLCQNMNIPYASYYHSGSSQDVFYKQTKKKDLYSFVFHKYTKIETRQNYAAQKRTHKSQIK